MEFDKKVIVDVDGFIETGKQFDLDLRLPEDDRNVVYGIIRDCKGKPVEDAVVKLVEVCKDERKPVSHTFTDKQGEFVFGPLCPSKSYSIEIWVNRVKHVKICKVCEHEGKCLKGIDLNCEPHFYDKYDKFEDYDYKEKYEEYKKNFENDYEEEYKEKNKCDKETENNESKNDFDDKKDERYDEDKCNKCDKETRYR